MTQSISTEMPIEMVNSKDHGETLLKRAIRKMKGQPMVLVSFGIVFTYIFLAVLGYMDLLPDFQERVGGSREVPEFSFAKILGTDMFGRSVFFKILAGLKTAMTMGFLVTLIAVPVGVILGTLSGYYGGRVDSMIVWLYTVVVSVPYILLVMAISYALGKGLLAVCIAIAGANWVSLCRLVRGEVMKHKDREYVLATRLLGAKDNYIMFRHILPNVMHIAIITASLMVLGAIKIEVVLTYIGVGVQDGSSWGSMISEAPGELVNGVWWPLAGVATAMFLIIYALNVVGDALRDALDPKLVG